MDLCVCMCLHVSACDIMPRDWLMRSPVHFGGRYTLGVLIKFTSSFQNNMDHGVSWSPCSLFKPLRFSFRFFSSYLCSISCFDHFTRLNYSCASTVDCCISHITIYSFQFLIDLQLICLSNIYYFGRQQTRKKTKTKTNWTP